MKKIFVFLLFIILAASPAMSGQSYMDPLQGPSSLPDDIKARSVTIGGKQVAAATQYITASAAASGDIFALVNSAWAAGYTHVTLPPGDYSTSTTLSVPNDNKMYTIIGPGNDVTPLGDGPLGVQITYTATDNSNAIEVLGTASDALARVQIIGIRLVGNAQAGNGIVFDRCNSGTLVEDVTISGFTNSTSSPTVSGANGLYGNGISIKSVAVGLGSTYGLVLRRVRCSSNNVGLLANGTNLFGVYDCMFGSNYWMNHCMIDTRMVSFYSCVFQSQHGDTSGQAAGNMVIANARDAFGPNYYGCHFEEDEANIALRIDDGTSYGIYNVNLFGCELAANEDAEESTYCLYANAATGVTINAMGVRFATNQETSTSTAIYLTTGATMKNMGAYYDPRLDTEKGGSGPYTTY